MRPLVVIWGAGGHARVVANIVRLGGVYDLIGFLYDLQASPPALELGGLPVFNGRRFLEKLRGEGVDHLLVAVGDGAARLQLAQVARGAGFRLPTAIHPRAVVAGDAKLGSGTVVAAGAIINP